MKILMVHPHEVYSPLEPWTTRIINFGKEFVKNGNQVKIAYFPLEFSKADSAFYRDGIEFIPFCRRAGLYNIFKNCFNFSNLTQWADIIHLQKCFHYAAFPSIINGFFKNKPLHYDWDDCEEMIYYESADPPIKAVGGFLNTLERNIPHFASTISVSSRQLRNFCLKIGITQDKIFHVPVGADLIKFNPKVSGERVRNMHDISKPLVLYLGQLHGGQYVNLFLQTVKLILKRGIKADFMVVGDGSRAQELRGLAKGLGLDKNIIFTGAVNGDEVPEYIAASDVAVACFADNIMTRCKSPLKVAEYLASGKAIVASRVGEVEEMVGDAGILVAPGKAVPLAESVSLLLSDKHLREDLGKKARARAEEIYNWRVSSATLLDAYQQALNNGS